MHNYHDTKRTFPPGYIGAHLWGWGTMILPYLDQVPTYNKLSRLTTSGIGSMGGFSSTMTMIPGPNILQTQLTVFRCPSDSGQMLVTMPTGATKYTPPTAANTHYGRSNYAGVLGSIMPASGTTPTRMNTNGAFSQNSSQRIRDFTDGTSNTFLIGERRSPTATGGYYSGGDTLWSGVGDPVSYQGVGLHLGNCMSANRLNFRYKTTPTSTSPIPYTGFSSAHVGGRNSCLPMAACTSSAKTSPAASRPCRGAPTSTWPASMTGWSSDNTSLIATSSLLSALRSDHFSAIFRPSSQRNVAAPARVLLSRRPCRQAVEPRRGASTKSLTNRHFA